MNKTKKNILSAAEELIEKKGVDNTTIAEIARKVNVADSLVHQYFNKKDDLLFAVATNRISDAFKHLEDHLQGIRDAESCLSKAIWHSLNYNDQYPGYAKIIFDCRSKKAFYSSPAYQIVRTYAESMLSILRQGVESGIFRRDVDLYLIRDIIFGIIDYENSSCAITGEIKKSGDSLDDILSLILPMIVLKDRITTEDKKKNILTAAENIFAEYGFDKARVKDIAKAAKVAEGTIYEYFKNKEDLLLSIADMRIHDHIEALPEVFQIKSPPRKLRRLIRYHFSLYLTHRDFLKLFLFDVQHNMRFYKSETFRDYQKYYRAIETVIEEGKNSGDFRADINARIFRNMFLGAFYHMALRWSIKDGKKEFDKMMEINNLVDLFSTSVLAEGSTLTSS